MAHNIAGRIVVADHDHVAAILRPCAAEALGVFPDELCVVAKGIEIRHIDRLTMIGILFILPRGHGIGYPVISGCPHEEVLAMLLFPPA